MTILGFDHVQISIPASRLEEALPFYVDVLGLSRVLKPVEMPDRGGAWLTQGAANLHLGEEAAFSTDGRAHPALSVDNLEEIMQRATAAGFRTRRDTGPEGFIRASVFDVFGNRIELMQKTTREEQQ